MPEKNANWGTPTRVSDDKRRENSDFPKTPRGQVRPGELVASRLTPGNSLTKLQPP